MANMHTTNWLPIIYQKYVQSIYIFLHYIILQVTFGTRFCILLIIEFSAICFCKNINCQSCNCFMRLQISLVLALTLMVGLLFLPCTDEAILQTNMEELLYSSIYCMYKYIFLLAHMHYVLLKYIYMLR